MPLRCGKPRIRFAGDRGRSTSEDIERATEPKGVREKSGSQFPSHATLLRTMLGHAFGEVPYGSHFEHCSNALSALRQVQIRRTYLLFGTRSKIPMAGTNEVDTVTSRDLEVRPRICDQPLSTRAPEMSAQSQIPSRGGARWPPRVSASQASSKPQMSDRAGGKYRSSSVAAESWLSPCMRSINCDRPASRDERAGGRPDDM